MMETMPMPLSPEPEAQAALDDFRITEPFEILSLLRQMCEQRVLVTLATPSGAGFTTTVWEVDRAKGVVRFSADRHEPQLERVLDADDAVAVAYLDNIKIQFDVDGLVHVHAGQGISALNCSFPREMFRFQRRSSFRVRPLLNAPPSARMVHPTATDHVMELRVIDVSIGGVALFLPEDQPPLEPGSIVNKVLIDLDAETRFSATLRIAHVTALNPSSRGVRVGCEMERMSGDALRSLQRFIDQTQKQRRMMALDGS